MSLPSIPASVRHVSPYDNAMIIPVVAVKAHALALRIDRIIEDLGTLPLAVADGPDGAHIVVNAVLQLEIVRNQLLALEPVK